MQNIFYKKLSFIMVSILCIFMMILSPLYAYNDVLNEVNIDVVLNDDGSASFKETWITEVGSGTENYKVFNNMGDSKISDFSVIDENGKKYTFIDNWDVNKTRSQKAYKCGIIQRGDSYELCWGVGDYGHREYTITYHISNFLQQYKNDQGFNYAFLSDMDLPPQKVYVKLSSSIPFTDEMSDIYAFGYTGEVHFVDGAVVLKSHSSLSSYSKVQLLMRIDNGTFQNAHENNSDYQDILDDAMLDSDYTNDDGESWSSSDWNFYSFVIFTMILPFALEIGLFIAIVYVTQKRRKQKRDFSMTFEDQTDKSSIPKEKYIDIYRDIPCRKDLYYFYYTALKAGLLSSEQKGGLIGAILLQWIKDKQIEFVKAEDKGLIFKKEGYAIDLNRPIQTSCSVEEELLSMLRRAAGSNGILETNEFEKWCKKNYSKVDSWFDRVESFMESWMINQGMLDKKRIPQKVLFITYYTLKKTYTVEFKKEIEHVIGFKKFLKEMSLIDEKEVIEVKLWEEYLIFATILGIADEVEKQLKIRCPEFNEVSYMETVHTTRIMRDFTYRSVAAAYRAQSAASSGGSSRSSGGGGSSSSSGGGSSHSGGGGGGRR